MSSARSARHLVILSGCRGCQTRLLPIPRCLPVAGRLRRLCDLLLPPELAHIQIVEEALLIEQFVELAALDDLTVVNDQDLIGVLDRADAVRYDETGSPMQQLLQRGLNQLLSAGIHTRSRFVEDQDARIRQRRARDRDQTVFDPGSNRCRARREWFDNPLANAR